MDVEFVILVAGLVSAARTGNAANANDRKHAMKRMAVDE
jgi:hypothetical protein